MIPVFNETKIGVEVFQFVEIQILEILYPENGIEYCSETLGSIYKTTGCNKAENLNLKI
jgi:hypothetical protein